MPHSTHSQFTTMECIIDPESPTQKHQMQPTAAAPEDNLPFEPGGILRLIRGLLAYDNGSDSLPDPEAAGMLLWDLSADAEAAPGLLDMQLLPALAAQLAASAAAFDRARLDAAAAQSPSSVAHAAGHQQQDQQDQQQEHSSSQPSVQPVRVIELCCGIIANLYSTPAVVQQLVSQTELTAAVAALLTELEDAPALSELARLLTAAVSTPQGCVAWLPVLASPASINWLLHIISNTLYPPLLERSLQLAAALLAAGNEAAAAAAAAGDGGDRAKEEEIAAQDAADGTRAGAEPAEALSPAALGNSDKPSASTTSHAAATPHHHQKQQQKQQEAGQVAATAGAASIPEQLLQHGLMQALEAVLLPAAAEGARAQQQLRSHASSAMQANSQHQAAAAAGNGGGWSEDDDEGEDASAPHNIAAVGAGAGLAQQTQRVYQQTEVLLALVSCLEQLGQQQQQEWVIADALQRLPALPQLLLQLMVACQQRAQQEVLELLLPVLVVFRAGVLPLLRLAACTDKQQEDASSAALWCLQCLACIAAVLHDCCCGRPDESFDAMDAAWYLLAATLADSSCGFALQLLESAWAQRQLLQLCRCVAMSSVPETSERYAATARTALMLMIEQTDGMAPGVLNTLRQCTAALNERQERTDC